jgi:hypothetical protein
MNFFTLVSAKVLGWIMAALGAVIAFLSIYRSGKSAARNEAAAEGARANERMLDAAVNAPKEKSDVVKDLRAGRF